MIHYLAVSDLGWAVTEVVAFTIIIYDTDKYGLGISISSYTLTFFFFLIK
jgi:hypothetical protein